MLRNLTQYTALFKYGNYYKNAHATVNFADDHMVRPRHPHSGHRGLVELWNDEVDDHACGLCHLPTETGVTATTLASGLYHRAFLLFGEDSLGRVVIIIATHKPPQYD